MHDIETTITLDSGAEIGVRFNYMIHSYINLPAIRDRDASLCFEGEFDVEYSVYGVLVSVHGEYWRPIASDTLLDLISEQQFDAILDHYESQHY